MKIIYRQSYYAPSSLRSHSHAVGSWGVQPTLLPLLYRPPRRLLKCTYHFVTHPSPPLSLTFCWGSVRSAPPPRARQILLATSRVSYNSRDKGIPSDGWNSGQYRAGPTPSSPPAFPSSIARRTFTGSNSTLMQWRKLKKKAKPENSLWFVRCKR